MVFARGSIFKPAIFPLFQPRAFNHHPCVIIFPFPPFQRTGEMERPCTSRWCGCGWCSVWRILHLSSLWLGNGLECCQRKLVQRWDGQNEQCIYPFQFFHNGLFYINLVGQICMWDTTVQTLLLFFQQGSIKLTKRDSKDSTKNISISKNHGGKSIRFFLKAAKVFNILISEKIYTLESKIKKSAY